MIRRLLLACLALALLAGAGAALVIVAAGSNSGRAASFGSGLSALSKADLARLPFCAAGRAFGVAPEVLAGVVTAEKQLNRDWSDSVQDALFALLARLRGEAWWDDWARRALAAASGDASARAKNADWSRDVAWTGIVFSIGPSQITPRTALRACEAAPARPSWCGNVRGLVRLLLDERGSLEAAALILAVERQAHREATGVDVAQDPGRWATLYNFGGDIFRARFRDDPARGPNGFGRWVERHATEIRSLLACD